MGSIPTPPASADVLSAHTFPARYRMSSGRGREDSQRLGQLSEIEAVAALSRAGYFVSRPVVEGLPYDCIVDNGQGVLWRVQIKTGYVDRDVMRFSTRSTSYHRAGGTSRDYRLSADVFVVWVPETRACYLVPVEVCGRHEGGLRLTPPEIKRGVPKGAPQAAHYLVED